MAHEGYQIVNRRPINAAIIGDIQDDGLSFLKESQSIQLFQRLQADILLQAYGIYVLQFLDASLEDNQANPKLYQLLLQVLEALNQGLAPQVIVAYLEIHLLPVFGIHIQWASCAACQVSDRILANRSASSPPSPSVSPARS